MVHLVEDHVGCDTQFGATRAVLKLAPLLVAPLLVAPLLRRAGAARRAR